MFDTRGNETDTVIIRHCTIYLISDRVFRNLGGEVKYFEFDHNTVINTQGRNGSFSLGKTHNIKITNNLMMNPLYMGNHPGTEEQTHPDNENFYVLAMDTAYSGLLEIHHNNITFTQEVKDYYATNDSVSEPAVLEPLIASTMGEAASEAFFTEEIAFTNVPPFPMDYLVSIFANPLAGFHPDNFDTSVGMPNIDASYPTTSQSFTGDEDGKPLGSHMWWDPSELNGISKNKSMNGLEVCVYPNPATETLHVAYTLDSPASVNISVYDLQGRMIMTQFEGFKSAGLQRCTISLSSLTSGVYFLHVQSDMQGLSVQQLIVK